MDSIDQALARYRASVRRALDSVGLTEDARFSGHDFLDKWDAWAAACERSRWFMASTWRFLLLLPFAIYHDRKADQLYQQLEQAQKVWNGHMLENAKNASADIAECSGTAKL